LDFSALTISLFPTSIDLDRLLKKDAISIGFDLHTGPVGQSVVLNRPTSGGPGATRDRRGNAIIIGAGQLGLRVVQVYADVGGHLHSIRKPANASADDKRVLLLLGWSAHHVWASVGRL